MATIRDQFVQSFSESEAAHIEAAATEHGNSINDTNKGSDPFKWALLICIGYQCMELDSYREYHNITTPWSVLKQWIKTNADLGSHDGDCDYISLIAGVYNEYTNQNPKS